MSHYLLVANGWDVIRLRRTTVPAACGRLGTPEGTRTPGPLLRRQLLYPPELQARMERVMGIEPTRPAWKAGILPLNYTRVLGASANVSLYIIAQAALFVKGKTT